MLDESLPKRVRDDRSVSWKLSKSNTLSLMNEAAAVAGVICRRVTKMTMIGMELSYDNLIFF